ncbi:MAG: glycosyltransferase family 2 protein, partial [Methanophagales archaeon]|nr:glycosyltransferase family 2 protein [Methanophagales archaeon]
MYKDWKIAVVVPAYNEAQLIAKTVTTIPGFIDIIIVVDDKSTDDTVTIVESLQRDYSDSVILITHERNRGVGGAIKTGYEKALALDMDIIVVMGGDAQMDPGQLPKLLGPILGGRAEYTKGNRLEYDANLAMPRIRRFGNGALTLLTKIASGYWGVIDPQNGYTAISKQALKKLELDNIYDRYGCPNDMLIELNIRNIKIMDVEMPPVYQGEKSGIKIRRYFFTLSWLLFKGFFRRLNRKYGGLHFHPLWLFYSVGMILFLLGLFFSGVVLYYRIVSG